MKHIILTGGGSAGHVTPNLALAPQLMQNGFRVVYMGTRKGIEHQLVTESGIEFRPVHSGKFRRYFDLRNVSDPFFVALGFVESLACFLKLQPSVVFSKGGFVSCPVVWAAWVLRIPVIVHESDMTPGLANRLCQPFARRICYTFPESEHHFPPRKRVLTGLPIRQTLLHGSRTQGLELCGFSSEKPVLLVIGGSLGSHRLNTAVREALPCLTSTFQVAHICGPGELCAASYPEYWQAEYVSDQLPNVLAMADCVVSRGGSTTIHELMALNKPTLLIPLGRNASRGDQLQNAKSLLDRGLCRVLDQLLLSTESLVREVARTYEEREALHAAMQTFGVNSGTTAVMQAIEDNCK